MIPYFSKAVLSKDLRTVISYNSIKNSEHWSKKHLKALLDTASQKRYEYYPYKTLWYVIVVLHINLNTKEGKIIEPSPLLRQASLMSFLMLVRPVPRVPLLYASSISWHPISGRLALAESSGNPLFSILVLSRIQIPSWSTIPLFSTFKMRPYPLSSHIRIEPAPCWNHAQSVARRKRGFLYQAASHANSAPHGRWAEFQTPSRFQ